MVKVTVGEIALPERHRHGSLVVTTGVTLTIGNQRFLLLDADTTRLAYALEKAGRRVVSAGHDDFPPVVFECEVEPI